MLFQTHYCVPCFNGYHTAHWRCLGWQMQEIIWKLIDTVCQILTYLLLPDRIWCRAFHLLKLTSFYDTHKNSHKVCVKGNGKNIQKLWMFDYRAHSDMVDLGKNNILWSVISIQTKYSSLFHICTSIHKKMFHDKSGRS